MAFFQPTDITGCFGWYRAGSIGYNAASGYVTYWPDESGSGNYLNLQYNGSGTITAPLYFPNVVNSLPAVYFDGAINRAIESYPRRAGIPLAVSGLTLFTVFAPVDTKTSYPIWSIGNDQQASADKNNAILGVGPIATAPNTNASGWWFGWGRDAGFGISSYSANTGIMQANNEWCVRTDRFSMSTNRFTFSKNGADVASGTASTSYNTSTFPWIALGCDNETQAFYKGYIAEVVCYNRRLLDPEVTQVEDYLRFKYAIGSVGFPLFMWGAETPTGLSYNDFQLNIVGGAATSTGGISLYTVNKGISTSGISTYISGSFGTLTNNISLYIGNTSTYATGVPLYTSASTIHQSGRILYISGVPGNINTNIYLYTSAASILSSGRPLYMSGSVASLTSSIPLWTSAASSWSSGVSLYTGSSTQITSNFTLYESASSTKNSGVPLYIPGQFEISRIPMYMRGKDTYSTGISLYTNSSTTSISGKPLYTAGKIEYHTGIYGYISGTTNPSISSGKSFFLFAPDVIGRSGIYKTTPMYMYSHGIGGNIPLYLKNSQPLTPSTNNLLLYISGPATSGYSVKSTNLFLQNNTLQFTKAKKLFVRGDGSMDGASIYNKNMPLFIRQSSGVYRGMSMYMFGVGTTQSGISMFTKGVYNYNSGIPMFISGSGSVKGIPLYMNTQSVATSGKSIYMYGRPTITNNTIMYVNGY